IIMFFIVLFTAFGSVPDVRDRVFDAWEQIEKYSDDNYQSSTGIRIKLWISGVDIFSERAFLGNSKEDVQSIVESRITTGVFPEFLKPFLVHPNPNFHNQFIQSLVDSGLVGLMLVCLLVSAPYLLVIKSNCIGLRLFGISISLFVVICLSFDSLFLYNQTVILFCALLIMMFGCCKDVLREEE
ncbi:O-antigen ligase family protein, partial [Vibrio brasiliensis]|uniref:O-antigen ligase family protein n=1 Tax=Vibrio brasiliensis TaxID=170652 RepID=UPI001EFCBCFC